MEVSLRVHAPHSLYPPIANVARLLWSLARLLWPLPSTGAWHIQNNVLPYPTSSLNPKSLSDLVTGSRL
jgi:hypothetical protein